MALFVVAVFMQSLNVDNWMSPLTMKMSTTGE